MLVRQERKLFTLRLFLTFFILFFFVCNFNHALMIKLSLKKLCLGADVIIFGEAKEIQSQWSLDRSIILTIVTLQIHETLKGKIYTNQVLIQYPGGKVGDLALQVEDAPSFRTDEEVLVFLKFIKNVKDIKHSPVIALSIFRPFSVFGVAQGKYSIDSRGVARKSGYTLISKEKEPDRSLHLSNLKAKIRNFLRNNSKKREKVREESKY